MPHNLNVVLLEPEIPSNTGSIGRLCLATQSTLHLVEPLGFEITDSRLKRAGLDYWQHLDVVRHADWNAFLQTLPPDAPCIFFSKKAKKLYSEHRYQPGSYLIFGKETLGLPEELINAHPETAVRVPQYDDRVRSLNLSNVVSIAVYEALRQLGY
ncbi:putative rRNA methylase [Nitrospina gracilis 3/211]|uniref:Putative tRNA (cytidine(34)-2'-O)-methyltransferase n=1 Tax=Nitrospina gracilis (strain 3/211) TaxID=1266370 RepID=M1ZAQ9_NITG3|nr:MULTISPECIES: tRNA (cytidine(34)-2'-O)-methyltransferase [Nitrospina]MCF8723320.1 tRNA (cytidine/uridine-2'-O-)-methyltransferase [Nitrospina sp. Nb-3]CCQ90370.1 putative rRNA methylase [Nitrospina gracilis 3/211]